MGGQRWFAGKGHDIESLSIVSDVELQTEPGLRHLIAAVRQGVHEARYQLLLGLRAEIPDRLKHAVIGPVDSMIGYDAVHDADLTAHLLESMAAGATVGSLDFRHVEGAEIDPTPRSLVLGAEQSNTSLVYGEEYICKLFRRLVPGVNPELEIVTALAKAGSTHVAEPYGWIETRLDGHPTTLGILQRFLPTSSDGWSLALTSVRDLYASEEELSASDAGGDFSAESERLGRATGEMHTELATAFPTETVDRTEVKRMAEAMLHRLDRAVEAVPALAPLAPLPAEAFAELARLNQPVAVQRVHGDYHLGQVLRTLTEWIILDFEGEPGQPLWERRALASPLRDVAGMLRSFDYAARHLLSGFAEYGGLHGRAEEWATLNREAFLDGYATVHRDAREDLILLRALEFDKAVYEVVYEARHRPSWVSIPLAAFRT
ncbi:maltokinase N-terminal cap-like domain-containing protein [Rhizohabitans arisaemae]|uniref:maltokinase N-terminal cap-like domain-containing protein n=1 Tax=Rhizohabitans arisaemae TaxID=2720610 RepID=UPI0024B12280|nr:phosphotransferase [Rhizohabitans arisaemae]